MVGYDSKQYDGFSLGNYFGSNNGIEGNQVPFQFNTPGGPNAPGSSPDTFKSDNSFSLGDYTKLGTSAVNAYLGYQGLQLGQDQFDFTKNSFNTNLANQAKVLNTQLEDRQRARLAFGGGHDRNTEEGQAALQSDLQAYLKPRRVSGAPI